MSETLVSSQSPRVFDFEQHAIRIFGTPEEPWFVAADVCRVLDIANPTQAVAALDEDERMTVSNTDGHSKNTLCNTEGILENTLTSTEGIQRQRGNPTFNLVSESGLYSLIFRSRKAQAQAFKRWVTHEVLPAIRKTGRYELPESRPAEQALPGPERKPEPAIWSVPSFLASAGAVDWPDHRLMRFGQFCRLISKNFGLVYRTEMDAVWGELRVFPEAVLRLAWKRVAPVATAAIDTRRAQQHDDVLKVLAAAVGKLEHDSIIGLREMVAAARESGLCKDLIPATGNLTLDARKALGRRIQDFRGKELTDSQGRPFAFFRHRVKAGVRYPISFLNGAAAQVEGGVA